MGIFDKLKKNKEQSAPLFLYTEKELDEYEKYVASNFGNYSEVFHEIVSPDIHLDVIIIPPSDNKPYYTLVTMGAGAYNMKVPENLEQYRISNAEYVSYLPADWDIKSSELKDYWPIGMLKKIARLPVDADTWLGFGHTIHGNSDMTPLGENTSLNSYLLLTSFDKNGSEAELELSSGRLVRFYDLYPLYQEELLYKQKNGTEAFLDLIPDEEFSLVLDINRRNYCIE